MDFKVGADTVQTEYFFNEYFDYAGTEDDFKSTLYDKTVYDTVGGTNVVKDYNYEQSALYRLNNIKLSIGSGFIEQNFTFSGNTTRIFEIKYDFDNSTTTSTETYKYRYYYDNLGNISTVYYYENGSTVMKYNYEYDELNQLIQEDVYEYGNCSTYGDTCYTKYFKYDQRGNITDIKTYDYGEEETNDPVIPSFYQQNNGGWDADMTYRNYYDYQDIYNLDVGDPIPSITTMDFDYVDAFFGTPISGMSTSYTSGNLTTTTAGYYYRYYNATDGGNYNLTFKIVFKVGNPQPTVNAPEEHIRYYYQDDWMDQLLKYGVVTYNGTTEVEPTSFIQEYVYDDQGNPTYITNFDYEDMTYHHADLEYSGRQLTNIKIYNSSNVLQHELSYTYNDQGYRTSKTIDGTTVEYTLSGDKVLFETDGTYGIIYTYDADGKIIGFSYDDNVSSGDDYKDYFYIRNQQGDITKIFRMNGTEKIVLVEYEYDAWGNLIDIIYNTDTGYFVEAVNVHSVNQYFYRGYRYDSEIGLYYLNSRFYDSNVGRFINSDGQLGMPGYLNGHNSYAYAKNNPVLNYDPSGYLSKENWIKLAIGTAALAAAVALTVATGGALLPIFMTVGGGTLTGAGIGYLTGGVDGAIDGAIDGFMWASIFACASAGFKFVQAGGKSIVKPGSVGNPSGTGQTHHIFPKPAEKSLLQKFGLTRNDYLVKANNLNAHKGFQTWHRTYNKSVMTLIDKSDDIKALESGINAIYSTPDMIEKFGKIVINLIP